MRRARRLDPRPGVVGTGVEGDRHDRQAALAELLVQRLPDRQVEPTPSPRGIGDEEDLLATLLGQCVEPPVEIGQRKVGRLQRQQALGARAGGDAEESRALLEIDGERPIEASCDPGEISPPAGGASTLQAGRPG
jgi:hypothetical protein